MTWEPISLEDLYDKILHAEEEMNGDLWRFWQLIKIFPEEWALEIPDSANRRVWAVAVCGRSAIWYDEDEEEFVITSYQRYGAIGQPYTQMYQLEDTVLALFSHIQYGGGLIN